MKYNEDKSIEEVLEYIQSTYGKHYTSESGVQTQDLLETMDIAEEFCLGNAIKYLSRFGKKNGKNEKDLLKAMHYIVLVMHYSKVAEEQDIKEREKFESQFLTEEKKPFDKDQWILENY